MPLRCGRVRWRRVVSSVGFRLPFDRFCLCVYVVRYARCHGVSSVPFATMQIRGLKCGGALRRLNSIHRSRCAVMACEDIAKELVVALKKLRIPAPLDEFLQNAKMDPGVIRHKTVFAWGSLCVLSSCDRRPGLSWSKPTAASSTQRAGFANPTSDQGESWNGSPDLLHTIGPTMYIERFDSVNLGDGVNSCHIHNRRHIGRREAC